MICPICDDTVSELIDDPRFEMPVCYFCACELLGLPRKESSND